MKKPNIIIFYLIPLSSNKVNNWVDGFTSAIDALRDKFNFIYHNINESPIPTDASFYQNIDLIFIKANWNAKLEIQARQNLKDISIKKALIISGSKTPDTQKDALFYDILFYETTWYKQFIDYHPNIVHAFGIDTSKMQAQANTSKVYDIISIGSFKHYKRLHLLLLKKGRKLFVGEIPKKFNKKNLQDYFFYFLLVLFRIEIKDFMDYKELSTFINQSKKVYIPASINGGGERAVLEARSCGVPVEVEKDNPKLQSLLSTPIYDHHYYAEKLEKGIQTVL